LSNFFGAANEYYSQFYGPYLYYSPPILAIPGNHDGDVDPNHPQPSLAAFAENFCSATPRLTSETRRPARCFPQTVVFVVNLRAAQTLGFTFPAAILAKATQVVS
jgi:hypothetical protein